VCFEVKASDQYTCVVIAIFKSLVKATYFSCIHKYNNNNNNNNNNSKGNTVPVSPCPPQNRMNCPDIKLDPRLRHFGK
jgi:hypothetical protein